MVCPLCAARAGADAAGVSALAATVPMPIEVSSNALATRVPDRTFDLRGMETS